MDLLQPLPLPPKIPSAREPHPAPQWILWGEGWKYPLGHETMSLKQKPKVSARSGHHQELIPVLPNLVQCPGCYDICHSHLQVQTRYLFKIEITILNLIPFVNKYQFVNIHIVILLGKGHWVLIQSPHVLHKASSIEFFEPFQIS